MDDKIPPIHPGVSDLGELTEQIHDLASLGFDEVYLHHVGQQQRPFLEAFGEKVLPQLR